MSHLVYIGLGANLNDPVSSIRSAIEALSQIPNTAIKATSSLYRSAPMGPADQPDYVNAVALIETELSPQQVFSHTCAIEQQHGRTRNGEHWGPRTLDLDILLYANQIISTDELTIPHYGLKEREFVIYPMLEISANLVLPCGTSLVSLTETVKNASLVAIED